MKKLIYGGIFLSLVGIGFVACEKEEVNSFKEKSLNKNGKNAEINPPTDDYIEKMGPGIRIFKVELHRPVGKINKEGVDCNCSICAGFCDFEWFPDRPKNQTPTVGVTAVNSEIARLYFLVSPDVDDITRPIFYLDEDVKIHEDSEVTVLSSGQYNLIYKNGSIKSNGITYEYNSYIDVPFRK